jgi:hypothetical protein
MQTREPNGMHNVAHAQAAAAKIGEVMPCVDVLINNAGRFLGLLPMLAAFAFCRST